jgi:hypothetical protein
LIAAREKRSGPNSFFTRVWFLKVIAGGDLVSEHGLRCWKVPVKKTDNVQKARVKVRSVSGHVEVQEGQIAGGVFNFNLGNVHFEKIPSGVVKLKLHSKLM